MLKLEQALLVEGKYDAARLSNIVDGTILTTDGFRVFRDAALQKLLKRIEQTRLKIAREGGGRMREFSLSKQRLVRFQIRRKVGSGQFRNGQSRCFLVRCKARNYT